jgi:hypothetical protein
MDLLSRLVVAFDRRQRRRLGIGEFCADPECLLRLGFRTARVATELADGTVVRPGERVGVLHLWNEHMPRMPRAGPDLAWARAVTRLAVHSFRLLADYVVGTPALGDVHAFVGEFSDVYTPGTLRLLRRLGLEVFDPVPPRGPIAWTVDWAMRVWVWLLRRAFNPASVRGLRPRDLQRRRVWLGRRTLVGLYGVGGAVGRRT